MPMNPTEEEQRALARRAEADGSMAVAAMVVIGTFSLVVGLLLGVVLS